MSIAYDPAINQLAVWKEIESIYRFIALQQERLEQKETNSEEETNGLYFGDEASIFHDFIRPYKLSHSQRFTLGLALAALLTPDRFKNLVNTNAYEWLKQTCVLSNTTGNYFPTAISVARLLNWDDVRYLQNLSLVFQFEQSSLPPLFQLQPVANNDSFFSGQVTVADELLDLLLYGSPRPPAFSPTFPARPFTTALHWNDLVLPQATKNQLDDLLRWFIHGPAVMEQLKGRLKPGVKTLFYGPAGTGKSLAAALVGKTTQRQVYRIDLSQVVSKYIGETEKNLAQIFDRAQRQHWILFFDEADALFGKRTETRDAHDKYANQETSYLLMRIEEHDGPVILATNFKENIDPAFSRRFTQIIYFPAPRYEERIQIWKNALPPNVGIDDALNLEELAKKYELSGAQIVNAVAWCLLRLHSDSEQIIDYELLRAGISREMAKEGRTL